MTTSVESPSIGGSLRMPTLPWLVGFYGLALLAVVWAAATGEWTVAALAVTASAAVAVAVRSPESLLAGWIVLSPWLSYALRYPDLKSVVTFDRLIIPAIICGLLARAVSRDGRLPRIHLGEVAALAFAVVAMASVALLSAEKGYAMRTAVDAFLLPAALLYAVRGGFDVEAGRTAVVLGAVLLGVALPLAGLMEFLTGADVLAYAGASIFRTGIVRPNGPFITDNSYAMVGALVALFLVWSPRALGVRIRGVARSIWIIAIAGAALAAALPLFRTVLATLIVALAVPWIVGLRIRAMARGALVGVLFLVAALPAVLAVSGTAVFQDRIIDPSSGFSRAATYLAGADIVADHPLVGVGLTNYHAYFVEKFGDAWYVEVETVGDEGAESHPHNNVLSVWAELGLLGLVPFVIAGVTMAGEAWRRRDVESIGLMVLYALPGLTLVTCYSSDLNLMVAALVGVMLSRHRTGPTSLPIP
ncbi:MAG: O-antigen ligase family protein [Blastocatellia bacterium]|nr:O-antigen ligase family protein [Blastocatellia bacterium]